MNPIVSASCGALATLRDAIAAQLRRTNYAGRTVTLAEGIAVHAGLIVLTARRDRPVASIALVGIGLLGLADDLLEPRRRARGEPQAKGLRGHLGALAHGRLTTGVAKALGIPALAGLAAIERLGPRRPMRLLADTALVAGAANLVNLLDLRPGRALKAVIVPAALLRSGAVLLPAVLALPVDLAERGMLGDTGANALGAALGTVACERMGPLPRTVLLTGVVLLTLASERISFTAVIESTPTLRAIDQLGRRSGDDGERV